MKHLVSFSAGKDSVAMVLRMHELGEQIDDIIYYDVESWNWPQCNKVIEQVENIIGKKIIRIKGDHDNYFDWYMYERVIENGKNKHFFKSQASKGFRKPRSYFSVGVRLFNLDNVIG